MDRLTMNETIIKTSIFPLLLTLGLSASILAQQPTGDEILKKIDMNMTSSTQVLTSKMVIHSRRGSRTVASKSWMEGESKTFY